MAYTKFNYMDIQLAKGYYIYKINAYMSHTECVFLGSADCD